MSEPPRPDGYEPLAIGLMVYAGAAGFPREEKFWYVASAARRLDAAHRLFEEVRKGLDDYKTTGGHIADLFDILGDIELAIVAMHRAIDMAGEASHKLNLSSTLPANIEHKRKAIKELRDAFEHIDDRALGNIRRGKSDKQQAHTLFANIFGKAGIGQTLLTQRKLTYRQWWLEIDTEATELFKAVRKYLRDAGVELIDRHTRSQPLS
jgi:tetratricopeptide (TPR) repeat protein